VADDTETTDATKEAEEVDATQEHRADRPPTAEEEAAAEESTKKYAADSKTVAEHEKEMTDIGANAKGEGKID
jgi:hypothetical protein